MDRAKKTRLRIRKNKCSNLISYNGNKTLDEGLNKPFRFKKYPKTGKAIRFNWILRMKRKIKEQLERQINVYMGEELG